MNVLLVSIGYAESNRPSVSGGDMRWIKMAAWLVQNGHSVTVVATAQCKELLDRLGVAVRFVSVGALGPLTMRGGLLRMWASARSGSTLPTNYDVVFSVTELAYDVLAGWVIKMRNNEVKWGVVCHWVAPLFRRNARLLSGLSYALCGRLGLMLAKRADAVFCVSLPTLNKVSKFRFLERRRLHETQCGIDTVDQASPVARSGFDAVHIKRIAAGKGSYDVPEIWKTVCRNRPGSRLAMYGDGSPDEVFRLERMICSTGMDSGIHYGGPLYDEATKYKLLRGSLVFILPSYEENWAIVIGEALACGMEVVCYDLPDIRPIWSQWVHWVPVADKDAFARTVVNILNGQVQRLNDGTCPALIPWKQVFESQFRFLEAPK